jgi:hypothetical protein
VKDGGSGVRHVKCNGRPASVVDGRVECVVPLLPGVNAVVLLAVDAAGNSASAGVRVLREMPGGAITIFPDTLRIGTKDDVLGVRTEAGTAPVDVRWSTSDESSVTLDVYGAEVQVTPHATGEAVVTATSRGRTAKATVTVIDSEKPLAGELRWAIAPIAGLVPQPSQKVNPIDVAGPDVYVVDAYPGGEYSAVRGLSNRGGLIWRGTVVGSPMFAEHSGGVIARLGPERQARVIGWFDRLEGKPVWQFEARGAIRDATVAEDGTIYLVERLVDGPERSPPADRRHRGHRRINRAGKKATARASLQHDEAVRMHAGNTPAAAVISGPAQRGRRRALCDAARGS